MTGWLICFKPCHLSYQVTNYSWVRFSPSSWLTLFIVIVPRQHSLQQNISGYFEEFSLLNVYTKGIGPLTTLRHWSFKLSRMSRNREAWHLSFEMNRNWFVLFCFGFFNEGLEMWKNMQWVCQCGELLVLMLFLFMLTVTISLVLLHDKWQADYDLER